MNTKINDEIALLIIPEYTIALFDYYMPNFFVIGSSNGNWLSSED